MRRAGEGAKVARRPIIDIVSSFFAIFLGAPLFSMDGVEKRKPKRKPSCHRPGSDGRELAPGLDPADPRRALKGLTSCVEGAGSGMILIGGSSAREEWAWGAARKTPHGKRGRGS